MKDWQVSLIDQFIPDLDPRVWAVEDPDGVVRNERVLAALAEKGFDVLYYDDPVAFRYEYESRVRRSWERGERHPLIVLHDSGCVLPSDLLQRSHQKAFGLHDVFPRLDAEVLRELPAEWWGVLHEHSRRHPGKTFTASETEELALRICCKLVPELIDNEVEWLRKLIEMYRIGVQVPERLCRRMEGDLRLHSDFHDWPVFDLLMDSKVLTRFLQERWEYRLSELGHIDVEPEPFQVKGPKNLCFESPVLQVYWDNLFAEGVLNRFEPAKTPIPQGAWWAIAIRENQIPKGFERERLHALLQGLPEAGANYGEWIRFGLKYSQVVADLFQADHQEEVSEFWTEIWPEINDRFSGWLREGYIGLHNLPPRPPKMVHHIPKQLQRWHEEGEKVALIVLDGLSMAGWLGLKKKILNDNEEKWSVRESAAFAWLPSLTPISRQALFSGLPPKLFPDTLKRTDKDASRWPEYWQSSTGLFPKQIFHQLLTGKMDDLNQVPDFDEHPIRVYGATLSMPDELMHGVKLGWRALNSQLSIWGETGFMKKYLDRLLDAGFTVCLTADHGSLESVGTGKIQDGVLAERRGQRVRIYSEESLRDAAYKGRTEDSFVWDTALIPDGQFPLFAKARAAFVQQGDVIVSHGGASLDELLVPWVTIRKKEHG